MYLKSRKYGCFFVFRYTLTAEPAKSAFLVYPRTKSSINSSGKAGIRSVTSYGIPCLPQYPCPYNDLSGKISLLGLGTMRLPLRDAADQTSIDEEKGTGDF